MRNFIVGRIAAIGLFMLLACFARGQGGFVITDFDVLMRVDASSSVSVTETIKVKFSEPRHGIQRGIPIHYEGHGGVAQDITVHVGTVTDEIGNPHPTKIMNEGNKVKIRIGNPNITLIPGQTQTYVLNYTMDGLLNWLEHPKEWTPSAEIFWNATGDEWTVPIERSSFEINYPAVPGATGARLRVFKGYRDGKDHDDLLALGENVAGSVTGVKMSLGATSAKGTLAQPLNPGEGMTVVLDLPMSAVPKPAVASITNMRRYVLPNLGFLIPIVMTALMLGAWFLTGRDPATGQIAVRYEPPDDLSGAEAGTLLNEKADDRDIVAGLVGLIVKGFYTMRTVKGGLLFGHNTAELTPTDKPLAIEDPRALPEGITHFDVRLFGALANCGGKITEAEMRANVAPIRADLRQALYDSLVQRGYYATSPAASRSLWMTFGILALLILAGLAMMVHPFHSPVPSIVGAVLGLVPVLVIARWMPVRTARGAKAYRDLLGFREFIKRARGDEFKTMTERRPDQAMFEKYLPHAVAFGLTEQWAGAFKDILMEPPNWCRSSDGEVFYWGTFGHDFGGLSSRMGSAMTTPPAPQASSSGSGWSDSGGGGGFSDSGSSGGGGGGGGGDSW